MTERRFVDSDGTRWSVRATVPTMAERRRMVRRRDAAAGAGGGATGASARGNTTAERRKRGDRRRVAQTRAPVSPGHEGGWLTFESPAGKRRLAPIPAGWDALPEDELRRLCARAVSGPRWRGRLIE